MIEARREGCGLDSSGRSAAGSEERAGKRAKVGLKSTRKGFYSSGVSVCMCTCASQKGFFFFKESVQPIESFEDIATAN